jgi:hypothetical protein
VGKRSRANKRPTGLEPIKGCIPWDERCIVFERVSLAADQPNGGDPLAEGLAPTQEGIGGVQVPEQGSWTGAYGGL